MIKVDYKYSSIGLDDLKELENRINDIVINFNKGTCKGSEFTGWYELPVNISQSELSEITEEAQKIRKTCNAFVVCGIGGSYLGARAVIEAVKGFNRDGVEIIYLGNTFDERYTSDILNYLVDKEICVNVISKSGSTLETAFAFRKLKELLIDKYGEEYYKRVYVTTDAKDGCLRKMADKEKYKSYVIPGNIGGRYSVFTPVGLLPLAVAGVDIVRFVSGAKEAFKDVQNCGVEDNIAYQYAAYRYLKYVGGNKVELLATYSPYLGMLSEWWKQLFGESEGKDGKGLFPASVNFSTDLHSLGQFIQQGSKILFITQFRISGQGDLSVGVAEDDIDNLNYLKTVTLNEINLKAQEGTNKAHYEMGCVDNFTFTVDVMDEFNVGYLLYTFMYSCMISANLLGVNPFDQPGVEFYKQEMKKLLKK